MEDMSVTDETSQESRGSQIRRRCWRTCRDETAPRIKGPVKDGGAGEHEGHVGHFRDVGHRDIPRHVGHFRDVPAGDVPVKVGVLEHVPHVSRAGRVPARRRLRCRPCGHKDYRGGAGEHPVHVSQTTFPAGHGCRRCQRIVGGAVTENIQVAVSC